MEGQLPDPLQTTPVIASEIEHLPARKIKHSETILVEWSMLAFQIFVRLRAMLWTVTTDAF